MGKRWHGDEGTADNGIIVKLNDGTNYEILGLHKLGSVNASLINLRLLANPKFPTHILPTIDVTLFDIAAHPATRTPQRL